MCMLRANAMELDLRDFDVAYVPILFPSRDEKTACRPIGREGGLPSRHPRRANQFPATSGLPEAARLRGPPGTFSSVATLRAQRTSSKVLLGSAPLIACIMGIVRLL